jgi:DHA3 family macrolide efflux protein-like MFS transporter
MINNSAIATESKPSQSMRPFFIIWTGQAVSLLGSRLVQFALVWWLTEMTGSATMLALASMMAVLPQIFVNPFAGALVDRLNRRRVMMVADGTIALATVGLAVLYALDVVQVWHVFVLMFIRAAVGAFHWPAMQASTTLMVPEKHLSRVAGMNQSLQGFAGIVVPPLGALILALLPIQGVLAIDVTTALLAITTLFFIPIPQPADAGPARSTVLADMREGLRFVWGWTGMMILMVIAAVFNMLLHAAFSMLPLMVTLHFGGGALELGWLQSAGGIGMIFGGITLSVWGGFKRRIVTAMPAGALMGIGLTVLGLTPASAFPLAVGAQFFIGFMSTMANASLAAILQATVPPEIQGRVFTLLFSVAAAMSPLGLAVAGPVADRLGVQSWFLIAGAVMFVLSLGALFIPAILRIEDKGAFEDQAAREPIRDVAATKA